MSNRDMNRDTNRDIQDSLCFLRRDEKRDISGVGIGDTPPMSRLASGHVPHVPCPDVPDVPVHLDSRAARRAAFATWIAAGRPWPPPAGLVSACLTPLVRPGRERRW
jgi:hypothetical protein